MNLKKPVIAGLMCLSALAPCKAQKAVQFISETGVTGKFNKELSGFAGGHVVYNIKKFSTDLYCGAVMDSQKQFAFEAVTENEYNWSSNISSWLRGTLNLSKKERGLTSEISPLKLNTSVKKFDISLAPAYVLEHDFTDKEVKQGFSTILTADYNITPQNIVEMEFQYSTEPTKKLFDTYFGKFKDNASFTLSYKHKF